MLNRLVLDYGLAVLGVPLCSTNTLSRVLSEYCHDRKLLSPWQKGFNWLSLLRLVLEIFPHGYVQWIHQLLYINYSTETEWSINRVYFNFTQRWDRIEWITQNDDLLNIAKCILIDNCRTRNWDYNLLVYSLIINIVDLSSTDPVSAHTLSHNSSTGRQGWNIRRFSVWWRCSNRRRHNIQGKKLKCIPCQPERFKISLKESVN